MLRHFLLGKIHRATVTRADLDYVGSITIDEALIEAAGFLENEKIDIYDVTNGARLSTYVIPGRRGSGEIGINGAAAHLVKRGDLVIGGLTILRAYIVAGRPLQGKIWHLGGFEDWTLIREALAWLDQPDPGEHPQSNTMGRPGSARTRQRHGCLE